MKYQIALLGILSFAFLTCSQLHAQSVWNDSDPGGNIYYNGGNVGIGTSNPDEKLDIQNGSIIGYSSVEAFLKIKRKLGQPSIKGVQDGSSGYDGHIIIDAANTAKAVYLNHYLSANVYLATGGGKVGVGTSTPAYKLDVNGSVRVGDADGSGLLFSEFTSALTDVPGSTSGVHITGPVNAHIVMDIRGNNSTDGFYVRVPSVLEAGPTVDKTAFVVKADGHVGIGTTDTHGYELAVAGGVLAEKVYLEQQANWPDYVFSSRYNLKSLEETEAYIEANHHLPEIPSAMEVEEMGYDLGQMNAKLLQKIEELTLHLIEQNKEMKALKSRMGEMEKQLD